MGVAIWNNPKQWTVEIEGRYIDGFEGYSALALEMIRVIKKTAYSRGKRNKPI